MLKQLMDHPEKGLLGYIIGYPVIVQYWQSLDHLMAFAEDADSIHPLAWKNYWQRVGQSPRTGIWHETYHIRAGQYETIYGNMPAFGLGAATGSTLERNGSRKAKNRMTQHRPNA